MKLDIPQVKKIIYPVRFDEQQFKIIKKLAKQNSTTQGKIIRALIEKGLTLSKTEK